MSSQGSVRLALTVEGSIFAPDQQHRLIEVARLADEADVDYLTIPEHVLMGSHASHQQVVDMLAPVDGSVTLSMEQVPALAAAGINVVRVPLRRFLQEPDQVPVERDREALGAIPDLKSGG